MTSVKKKLLRKHSLYKNVNIRADTRNKMQGSDQNYEQGWIKKTGFKTGAGVSSLNCNPTLLTDNSLTVKTELLLGVVSFKTDHVEHFVDGVMRAHNSNVPKHPGWKVEVLPGPAQVFGVINNLHPVFLVHRYFNVIGVASEIIKVLWSKKQRTVNVQ
jgi:hypothetical protein